MHSMYKRVTVALFHCSCENTGKLRWNFPFPKRALSHHILEAVPNSYKHLFLPLLSCISRKNIYLVSQLSVLMHT